MARLLSHVIALVSGCLTAAGAALAAPGIDLAANNVCPGVAGALSRGEVIDCAALASAGRYVSVYGTFVPAENIPDLKALDVQLRLHVYGDLQRRDGSFWNGSPGSCLAANGGAVQFIGSKPTNGDPCGTALAIREVFTDGGTSSGVVNSTTSMEYFASPSSYGSVSVTTSSRVFAFEMRFDPAFSCDAGGPCGTCLAPVCISWLKATPVSASGLPTTTLTAPTGTPGITNQAEFAGGCETSDATQVTARGTGFCDDVKTRAQTWGLLKTLYR